MFRIKIAHRLKPFSHLKKTKCLIPRSTMSVEVMPGLLVLHDLVLEKRTQIFLDISGPISQFTVEQDLEKAKVNVLMKTKLGDVRYALYRDDQEILLKVLKAPKGGLKLNFNDVEHRHAKGEEVILTHDQSALPQPSSERLFLGVTKGQNIEGITWRHEMKEVIPLIYRLSQLTPSVASGNEEGGCYALLSGVKSTSFEGGVARLYGAGFESLLLPRSNDTDYQGIVSSVSEDGPLALLNQLKLLILSVFIEFDETNLAILPNAPQRFVAGKLIGVQTPFGKVDLEWTKRKLKRMAIWASKDAKITLKFPKNVTSYSMSVDRELSGVLRKGSSPLKIYKDQGYFFTHFKK